MVSVLVVILYDDYYFGEGNVESKKEFGFIRIL